MATLLRLVRTLALPWPPEEATAWRQRGSGQDGSEEFVLEAEPTDLEAFGEGIRGGLNLLLDPDDVLVDFVVLVVEAAEVRVGRLELDDGVAVFRELAEEWVFE